MSVIPSPVGRLKFFDTDGVTPLAGGFVYTYATGTLTPAATYTNLAGTSANTNPIVLDSNGEAVIYLTAGRVYDWVVTRSDATVVQSRPGIFSDGDSALRDDIESTATGLGLALDGTAAGKSITQVTTNNHFVQNNAILHKMGDRILLAGATANDGLFPNVAQDWMTQLWVAGGFGAGPMASAILGVANNTNPNNMIGMLSAVQAKYATSAGTTPIGVFGCVFNDHATLATKAYGGYFEAHRTTATPLDTFGIEIDTRTMNASITPNPYQLGDVIGLQIASGAEWSATGQFDASAAIQIAPNPKAFKVGINFYNGALTDLGGGVTEAVAMPRYSLLSWYVSGGTRAAYITSSVTSASNGVAMDLTNNQVNMSSVGGALNFAFVHTASVANYLAFYSATAGNAVRILAGGTDSIIDVSVEPKGVGAYLKYGTHVGTGDVACNGYISIKDSGGTVRKLMTTA